MKVMTVFLMIKKPKGDNIFDLKNNSVFCIHRPKILQFWDIQFYSLISTRDRIYKRYVLYFLNSRLFLIFHYISFRSVHCHIRVFILFSYK